MVTAIAIDIGGTFIKIGIIIDGVIKDNTSIKADAGIGILKCLNDATNTINDLLTLNMISKDEITGIGIGFPGIVDSSKMKVLRQDLHLYLCLLFISFPFLTKLLIVPHFGHVLYFGIVLLRSQKRVLHPNKESRQTNQGKILAFTIPCLFCLAIILYHFISKK